MILLEMNYNRFSLLNSNITAYLRQTLAFLSLTLRGKNDRLSVDSHYIELGKHNEFKKLKPEKIL